MLEPVAHSNKLNQKLPEIHPNKHRSVVRTYYQFLIINYYLETILKQDTLCRYHLGYVQAHVMFIPFFDYKLEDLIIVKDLNESNDQKNKLYLYQKSKNIC